MTRRPAASALLISLLCLVLAACGGGGSGTSGGPAPPPTGSAPSVDCVAILSSGVDNITVAVTVDPVDDSETADVWVEYSTDNAATVWTATAHQTVPPGAPAQKEFVLTALDPATTYFLRAKASNGWGSVQATGEGRTGTDNVTISTTLSGVAHSFVIFRDNVQVCRKDNGGDLNYSGPSGNYKAVYIAFGATPYSIVDPSDNNVFHVSAGGHLSIDSGIAITNGRAQFHISGTGFTSSYEAPVNVGGAAWTVTSTITDSTNENAPIGAVATGTWSPTQTENLVTYGDPNFGTIYETMNGNLLYGWSIGSGGGWNLTLRQTSVLNQDGTALTGTFEETYSAISGTDYRYMRGTMVGTR